MDAEKINELVAELRAAVDRLQYRGKCANATDEDNVREEVYTEIDPCVLELETALPARIRAIIEAALAAHKGEGNG